MRLKDEHKQEAIIQATVKLVNQIGFVACSVFKIAKEANVSPATIYIYYKNKEDLIVSTYLDIKQKLGGALLKDFNESRPIRDICRTVWFNGFSYISRHQQMFQFAEQFSNSPYSDLVEYEEINKHFAPLIKILEKGKEQKIIKDVSFEMLSAFIFFPVMIISNQKLCKTIKLTDETIEQAFIMAWDAIKL